jgi:hypothetical protein
MNNRSILKLTLEEYSYKLSDLIYPAESLEMAILDAMERACDNAVLKCKKRIKKDIRKSRELFYAESFKMDKIIDKNEK